MSVYDDQKGGVKSDQGSDGFDDIIGHNFKPGEADQIEARVRDEHAKDAGKELDGIGSRQGSGESSSQAAGKDDLAQQEMKGSGGVAAAAAKGFKNDDPGANGGEPAEEGGETDTPPKKRGFRGWSRRKKWGIGLTAALTGGGGITAILLITLSPMARIEMLINPADSFYGAANQEAVDEGVENALNTYMTKKVFPNLGKANCHTTKDAGCLTTSSDSANPIGRMFNAWKENKLDYKLANQYGLVFGARGGSGGTTYFINTNGKDIDLKRGGNIWDSADTKSATKSEIRAAIKDRFKEASLYDRFYTRWKVGKLVEEKYGVKRCITDVGCGISDAVHDSINDKKNAFKAYFIRRVVEPYSENMAAALQCVLAGGCNFDPTPDGDQVDDNQVERRSSFSASVQERVDRLAATYATDKLADLAKQVDTISKDGIARYAFKEVMGKILGKDITNEAIDKVMTPLGWVNLASQIIVFIHDIGPNVKKITFAINSVVAVQTYMYYATATHEARAGKTDLTQFGSISDSLTTASVDDYGNSSDMTQTPMYQQVVNRDSGAVASAPVEPTLFNMTAYAAEAKHSYTCNDGKPLPAGEKRCPEEDLSAGNMYTTAISEASSQIPGFDALYRVALFWRSIGSLLSQVVGNILYGVLSVVPGFQNLVGTIVGWLTPFFQWAATKVIPNLLGSLTGGRLSDIAMAGADVMYNTSAATQLGGARISDADAAALRTAYLDEQQQQFQNRSVFARVFDTHSQYSLVTHLAAAMPTRTSIVASLTSVLRDPFGHFSSAVLGMFSPNRVFAAVTPQPDAFGMPQIAIRPSDIPTNVDEAWWDKNCPDDYAQKWLDTQKEDEETGMMIASKPEPCMLYKTITQVAGGLFDPSLLPQDAGGSSAGTTSGGVGTSIPTGDTITLAKQISTNPNITFQTKQESDYFNSVVTSGTQPGECSTVSISPILLGVILTLSQKYKLVLGLFAEGHNAEPGCDTDHHADGSAVDINGINPIDPNTGPTGTGTHVHFDPSSMTIVRQFYNDAGRVLAANGGGGLGQYTTRCFGTPLPPKVTGVTYFDDLCDHIHMDTRGHH